MHANKNMSQGPMDAVRHPDYKTQVVQILRSGLTPRLMRERLSDYHENDIAAALELLKKEERSKLYRVLDTATLAEVLEYSEGTSAYLGELSVRKRVGVLSEVEPTTAAAYLQGLEKPNREALLELMEEGTRREVLLVSSFDENEIGSKMTTNYVSVCTGIGVRQAMKELVAQAAENDNISTIYVVDEDETLVGAIDLKDLIIARETTKLEEITRTSYPYVYAGEQIDGRQKRFLIGKEARGGLVNGGFLGILSFLCIGTYLVLLKGQTILAAFSVSLCTGVALVVSILLSSVCGTVVPLVFKKLKIDPAVASGPLITTVNDLVAVISYYGLAWLLLIQVLGL